MHNRCVRLSIRVRPGAGRTAVGGAHDGALVVRVADRAVDGKATEAALVPTSWDNRSPDLAIRVDRITA